MLYSISVYLDSPRRLQFWTLICWCIQTVSVIVSGVGVLEFGSFFSLVHFFYLIEMTRSSHTLWNDAQLSCVVREKKSKCDSHCRSNLAGLLSPHAHSVIPSMLHTKILEFGSKMNGVIYLSIMSYGHTGNNLQYWKWTMHISYDEMPRQSVFKAFFSLLFWIN
jgi:hypothetical protein